MTPYKSSMRVLANTATKTTHDMALLKGVSSVLTARSSSDTIIDMLSIGAWQVGGDAAFKSEVNELNCESNKHFDCTCAPLRAQYRYMFHTTALGSNHTPTDCSRSEKRVPPVVRSEWGRIV